MTTARLLAKLYRTMSPARKRQLLLCVAVMLLGAVAELVTIGAVLPFLALLSGSADVTRSAVAMGIDVGPNRLALLGGVLLIAAAIVAAALRLVLLWVSQHFVMALGHDIGSAIFARALRSPYADHVRRHSSELLSGMDKVRDVVSGILQPGLQGATALVIAACIAALLIAISPLASMVAAISIGGVYAVVSIATRRRLRANSHILAASVTARTKVIQESLGAIRDVILDRTQPIVEARFDDIDQRLRAALASNTFMAGAPRFVVEAAGIVIIAVVALAMSLHDGGLVSALPVLGALALGAQRLLPLLHQAYNGWSMGVGNIRALEDVIALLEVPMRQTAPRLTSAAATFRRDIVFDDVSFGYTPDRPIIHRANLTIAYGERIGIVGTTGSGKSTLLDLLMGLLDTSVGEIRIDGVPLCDTTREGWQSQIAHVPQSIYLYDDSVAANIALGIAPDAIDHDRLRRVTEAACLDAFVADLPDGFDTRVGERGTRLSGGQQQRVGIARALYKDARVLILDEATSALDDRTEARVIDAIMRSGMRPGEDRTLIMIAHRRSTLAGCDRIIRVEQGQVEDASR